jgi:diadenosine tetraphosphatase ApaH/serine/threonine PP2A family protein phosphatase
LIEQYCFQGHTHVPGIFTGNLSFYSPDEIGGEFTLGDEKVQVNIGSVGQPRDGDNRACYVVLENPKVRYRRVAYDVEKTIAKIYAVPELDDFLGDRLREGR